jgi:uncharacterized membrane protein YeaQ/YmgE (transglycosylase-associated protein family)
MSRLLIYTGITIGGLLGAYLPVWLFNANPFGIFSISMGIVGSFVGLWAGYKMYQNIE